MADGDNNNKTRRRFLQATGGTAAALALAGCLGGGDGDGGGGKNKSNGGGGGGKQTTGGNGGGGGGKQTTGGNGGGGTGNEGKPGGEEGKMPYASPLNEGDGPGKTDRTYKVINGTMSTLDPIAATDTASGIVIKQIFDGLFDYPQAHIPIEPKLAVDYKITNKAKTYEFTVKEGAKFSNGRDVTAKDFVYSFERLAGSPNSRRAGFILDSIGVKHKTDSKGEYVPNSLNVKAVDKRTLRMELKKPNPVTLEILAYGAFSAVPEGIVGDIKGYKGRMPYDKFSKKKPIGAGPYTLKKWSPGSEAAVDARDNYHGRGPMTAGTHWQIIKKSNPQYVYSVVNRNTDRPSIPTAKYNPNLENPKGKLDTGLKYGTYGPMANGMMSDYYRVTLLATYYYGFNCLAVPKPVRKAVAMINNSQLIVNKIYKTPQKVAAHFTPPGIWPGGKKAYRQHAKKYPYGLAASNIQKAKKLMEKEGYGKNNPFKFTMLSYTSKTQKRILRLLRDKLAAAHIQMKITQVPFSTLVERAYSGQTDAYTLGWIADWPAPANFLNLVYPPATDTSTGDNISGFNWSKKTGDAAKEAIQAWEKLQSHPRPEKGEKERNEAVIAMEEAVWEDVPMITTTHSISQQMEYPWLYRPMIGSMGASRQKHNLIEIAERK